MWTWIKTELRYHRNSVLLVVGLSLLFALLAVPIMKLYEGQAYEQRSTLVFLVLLVMMPWQFMVYQFRQSLRRESRALMLAHGLSMNGVAGGRILLNLFPGIDVAFSLMLLCWIGNLMGIPISWVGTLVLLLMMFVASIYYLIVDHFADANQDYFKILLLGIPIIIPLFWYLNVILFKSFRATTPLLIELASWPAFLIIAGIGLLCTWGVYRLTRTRWAISPLVARQGTLKV